MQQIANPVAALGSLVTKTVTTRTTEFVQVPPTGLARFMASAPRYAQVEVSHEHREVDWRAVAAVGGVGLTAYAAYRIWRRLSRRAKVFPDPLGHKSESIIPGSKLLEGGRPPACQPRVGMGVDGGVMIVGSGLRIMNYLVTPTHNAQVGKSIHALHPTDDSLMVEVNANSEIIVAPDVSAFLLSESQWATLKIPQAKLAPLASKATATVVGGLDQRYSMGELRVGSTFGRVSYNASTLPGFSGSAYANGTAILGMHCHGGTQGGGYEILYLFTRLRVLLDQPAEGGDYWWQRLGYESESEAMGQLGTDKRIVRDAATGRYTAVTNDQWWEREQEAEAQRQWDEEELQALREKQWLEAEQNRIDRANRYAQQLDYLDGIRQSGGRVWADEERGRGPTLRPRESGVGPCVPLTVGVTPFSGEGQRPVAQRTTGQHTAVPPPPPPASKARPLPPPASSSSSNARPPHAEERWQDLIGKLSDKQLEGLLKYGASMISPASSTRPARTTSRPTPLPVLNGKASAPSSAPQQSAGR